MSTLASNYDYSDDVITLYLKGNINEHSQFPDLPERVAQKLIIDLRGISYINSVGIKLWVEWISKAIGGLSGKAISFRAIPKLIVDQINTVVSFRPPSVDIESFYVPFYCEDCDYSSEHLYKKDQEFAKPDGNELIVHHPELLCPKCEIPMELDVVSSKYFNFLDD